MKHHTQKDRNHIGRDMEYYIKELLDANFSYTDAYDVVKNKWCVEVKSCSYITKQGNKSNGDFRIGRFVIDREAHLGLLESSSFPIYVFIVRVDDDKIIRWIFASDVDNLLKKKYPKLNVKSNCMCINWTTIIKNGLRIEELHKFMRYA